MRSTRRLALGASLLASLAIVGATGGGASVVGQDQPTVVVGSDGFYESQIVAEIYAQTLEAAGFPVDRAGIGIGARAARAAAFESGQLNLVPEYVGSGLGYYRAGNPDSEAIAALETTADGETNRANLQSALDTLGIEATVLAISSGEDTNAAVVRQDTADELGLAKVSDLTAIQGDVRWGLPPECEDNALCRGALEGSYGITWPPEQLQLIAACDSPMALALSGMAIDVAWMCSTQPDIAANGWVVLEDDQNIQPAENLAPMVRNDLLAQIDGGADALAAILDPVSAALTTEVLTQLNAQFVFDAEDIEDIASGFLASQG